MRWLVLSYLTFTLVAGPCFCCCTAERLRGWVRSLLPQPAKEKPDCCCCHPKETAKQSTEQKDRSNPEAPCPCQRGKNNEEVIPADSPTPKLARGTIDGWIESELLDGVFIYSARNAPGLWSNRDAVIALTARESCALLQTFLC